MLNVAFRADGGKSVGMGHIMRCLSLAQTFRRNGNKVYFFSKLDEGIKKVSSEDFDVIRLLSEEKETGGFTYGEHTHLAKEADMIISLLAKYQIEILIIDTYIVSKDYFLTIKPHVSRLVYIDDVFKSTFPVDIIINGNITGEDLGYEKYYKRQELLIGPRYNMIRDEFRNLPPRTIREIVKEIMITTGGADPYNLTIKFLNILLKEERFKNLRFNVLIGNGFTNYAKLIQVRRQHDNVFLYANSDSASSSRDITYSEVSIIMLRSDLAISAGGSTLYEFASCGTPVMAFIMAENQELIVHKMNDLGLIKSLGWYNHINKYLLTDNLLEIIHDYQQRKEMSRNSQKLLDGKGTDRILQSILLSLGD